MRLIWRSAIRSAVFVMCASSEPQPEVVEPHIAIHDVPGDGDCLFSAVALSASLVDGTPAQPAAELRELAMDVLCPAGAPDPELELGGLPAALLIEPLGGEDEKGYCRRMRQAGQWGTTAELLALSRALRRPIEVHTPFGAAEPEVYGADEGTPDTKPLTVAYENSHYRAATLRLRGGATASSADAAACDADEAAVTAVLEAMHAASTKADAVAYLALFDDDATFLGTDPSERWPMAQFREYVQRRFDAGNGWSYALVDRHVSVKGDFAWFDESLMNPKRGACRGSGVLHRVQGGDWRLMQYNLLMAIPNDAALGVAAAVGKGIFR